MLYNRQVKTVTADKPSTNWYVYILRCADDSLYTGITLDIDKRLKEHNGIASNGAKYTQSRRPVTLVYHETMLSRSDACRREYSIKQLNKAEKERLVQLLA